jgi:hypothetical protein
MRISALVLSLVGMDSTNVPAVIVWAPKVWAEIALFDWVLL